MRKDNLFLIAALMSGLLASAGCDQAQAQQPSFILKYGVLAGLTGDPAASGQAWNAAAKLAVGEISATLMRMKLPMKVELNGFSGQPGHAATGRRGSPEAGADRRRRCHHRRFLFLGDERRGDLGRHPESGAHVHWRHESFADQVDPGSLVDVEYPAIDQHHQQGGCDHRHITENELPERGSRRNHQWRSYRTVNKG